MALKAAGTTAIGLAGLSSAASAQATEITECPYTINQSGEYLLTTNISNCSATVGISIEASDVVLDGGGHTLDGTGIGTSSRSGVRATEVSDITVKNIRLTDWDFWGIQFGDVSNGTMTSVRAESNRNGATIERFSTNTTVSQSSFSNNSGGGIGMIANGSDIRNNTVNNNALGIVLIAGGSGNKIMSNSVNANGRNGIWLRRASGVSPTANQISQNQSDQNGQDGIFLEDVNGNRVTGNTATGNGDDGIALGSATTNNTVTGNTVCGNDDQPVEDNGSGNTVRGNRETC